MTDTQRLHDAVVGAIIMKIWNDAEPEPGDEITVEYKLNSQMRRNEWMRTSVEVTEEHIAEANKLFMEGAK